jgi:dipeptidyl-peptidase-4
MRKLATVRVVVEETSKTFIHYSGKSWRHWLHSSGELIWMSERDGWCHLWLYDIKTGKPKHQITKGRWPVREVLHVDDRNARSGSSQAA